MIGRGWRILGGRSAYFWYSCLLNSKLRSATSRILHINLLLPLQGWLKQEGGLEKEGYFTPDAEDDEITEVTSVPILSKERCKRGSITPAPVSTQLGEVVKKFTFAVPESKVYDSSLLFIVENKNQCDTSSPFYSVMSNSESSDEMFTDFSHFTYNG